MRYFFILTIMLLMLNASAQNNHIVDSLQDEINDNVADTSKIKLYLKLGYEYEANYPDSALYFYNKALKLSMEVNAQKLSAKCFNYIGIVYWSSASYEKAIEAYFNSLKIFTEIGDKEKISYSYNNLGLVYWSMGNYDKALEYYSKSLIINEELVNKKGMSSCYTNIGLVYRYLAEYDKALDNFFKSLEIDKELGDKKGITYCYNNIGNIYRIQEKYKKSIEYFNKSLSLSKELGDKNAITTILGNISLLNIKLRNYEKAFVFAERSLDIAKEINSLKAQKEAYQTLATVSDSMHEYKKAFEFFKKHKEINDVIFNDESAKQIARMQVKYDTEKKSKKIELINKDNEILKERQLKIIVLFVAALVIVVLIMFFLFSRIRIRNKANNILLQKNKLITQSETHLSEVNTQLLEANATKDKFLSIIAHDLRNSFNVILGYSTELFENNSDYNIDEKKKMLQHIYKSAIKTNSLLSNLLNWALAQKGKIEINKEKLNLKELTTESIQLFQETANEKNVELRNRVSDSLHVFADKYTMSYVINNLIDNAIKFTQRSGYIEFLTDEKDDKVSLSVKDNGVGMSDEIIGKLFRKDVLIESQEGTEKEQGSGLGLLLCYEFVEKNNGQIKVISFIGKGTEFIIDLQKI